jgi:hypothetical protein
MQLGYSTASRCCLESACKAIALMPGAGNPEAAGPETP